MKSGPTAEVHQFHRYLPKGWFFLFFSGFLLIRLTASGQWTTLALDTFHGVRPTYVDLSTLLLWGGQNQPVSAFLPDTQVTDASGLRFNAEGITPQARSFAQFTNPSGLKTSIALDYPFPIPVDRNLDTIRISADFLWETLLGIGESGRVVLAMLHSYPTGGPVFGAVDSILSHHPFGRPAYHIRIMNKDGTLNQNLNAVMMYGGGHSRLGDFELFRNASQRWWLPGFITEPGGTSPGSTGVFPTGGSAQIRNQLIASTTRWRRFIWTLYPERMTLEVRNTSDAPSSAVKVMEMLLPKVDTLNPAPTIAALNTHYGTQMTGLPRLYYWFPRMEAFRFFWNGGSNVWIANLHIESTENSPVTQQSRPLSEEKIFVLVPNPGTDRFRIQGLEGQSALTILDGTGREVYRNSSFFPGQMVDGSQWKSGFYWIEIRQGSQRKLIRWIRS